MKTTAKTLLTISIILIAMLFITAIDGIVFNEQLPFLADWIILISFICFVLAMVFAIAGNWNEVKDQFNGL